MMDTDRNRTREADWLAFVLPMIIFWVFSLLAPYGLMRTESAAVLSAIIGGYEGLLLWGATWCALGLGRWIRRFLALVAAGLVLASGSLLGIYLCFPKPGPTPASTGAYIVRDRPPVQRPSPRREAFDLASRCVSLLPLALAAGQFAFWGGPAFGGWRIWYRPVPTRESVAVPRKFGISDLLGATAGVAIVLGFWRMHMLEGEAIGLAVLSPAIFGCLVLPIVCYALGERSLPRGLARTCAYVATVAALAGCALSLLILHAGIETSFKVTASFLGAMAFSLHASLAIARDLGYRLVRMQRS